MNSYVYACVVTHNMRRISMLILIMFLILINYYDSLVTVGWRQCFTVFTSATKKFSLLCIPSPINEIAFIFHILPYHIHFFLFFSFYDPSLHSYIVHPSLFIRPNLLFVHFGAHVSVYPHHVYS